MYEDYDFKLIIMLIAISVIGVLVVGSAKSSLQERQIMGLILGSFFMIVLSFFDYSFFLKFYWVIYFINLAREQINGTHKRKFKK